MGQCVSSMNQFVSSVAPQRSNNRRSWKKKIPEAFSTVGIKTHRFTDEYEICKEVLGKGSSGSVKLVKRITTKEKFALKVLEDNQTSRCEVQLQQACLHPHILPIVDVFLNYYKGRRCLMIVMEYMEGGTLYNRIRRGRINEREVAKIMRDLCSAVAHLHGLNIAHRDIKPENILYTKSDVLKLGDFGFAVQYPDNHERPLTTACYTTYYAPPEIIGNKAYDKSCDLWTLGVVMYILLCGSPPFFPQSDKDFSVGMQKRILNADYKFPSPAWDKVSESAKTLVRKLLQINPRNRPTIEDVMHDEWIINFATLPKKSLALSKINNKMVQNIHDTLEKQLKEMRGIKLDNVFVKPLDKAQNKLLGRRKLRAPIRSLSDPNC